MKPKKHRVFFAILPSPDVLGDIATIQQKHQINGAHYTPLEKVHITLLFLGSLNAKTVVTVKEHAAKVQVKKFNISFDKTGIFKKTQILWLGTSKINTEISNLHDDLYQQIKRHGVSLEKRKFKPHITLARKFVSNHFTNPPEPINFSVTHFYLMESIPIQGGVKYEILETYPLK